MFSRSHLLVAVGAALVVGLLLSDASVGESAPPVKIGFVNIFKVRSKSNAQTKLIKMFQAEIDLQRKKLKNRSLKNKKLLREEVPLFEEGTPDQEKLLRRIDLENYTINLEEKALRKRVLKEDYRIMEEFMNELSRVVDTYAEANGYSAIFLHRPMAGIKSEGDRLNACNQWVLTRNKALDLTDEVIKIMNKE